MMFRRLLNTVRCLLTRHRAERELDEELRFHIEMETQANIKAGMSASEARRVALRDLGGVQQTIESVRDVRWLWVDSVIRDVRYAARRFRREPGFALTIMITIGLAVGLATTIYSIAAGVLLRPLPFTHPNELVQVWKTLPEWDRAGVSVPEYVEWRDQCRSFTALAAAGTMNFRLVTSGGAEWTEGHAVTPNLFPMLGVRPILGRTFRPDEDQAGHNNVVLLDESFWRRAFGADPNVVGKQVRLITSDPRFSGVETFEIIGVVASSVRLRYQEPARSDLYVPRPILAREMTDGARAALVLWVFGRLRPGVSMAQAQAEVLAVFLHLSRTFVARLPGASVRVEPLHDELLGHTRPAFLLLGAAVLILLLIACANVANLVLASGLKRGDELRARLALGCSRARLIRQLATESLLLALGGGALGVVLAHWATPLCLRLAPDSLPRLDRVQVDVSAALVALGLSCVVALLAGIAPAILLSTPSYGGRFLPQMNGVTNRRRWGDAIVAAETAMVVILLAASGLVANSLWRLSHVELGFEPHHVLTMLPVLPREYSSSVRTRAFERDLLGRLQARPGVLGAAFATDLPFVGGGFWSYRLANGEEHEAEVSAVSGDFLRVLGVPLIAGRTFSPADDANPRVAFVNQRLARQLFPSGDVIGQRLGFAESGLWFEIVGIVGDITEVSALRNGVIREKGLNRGTYPAIYLPSSAFPDMFRYLIVRDDGARRDDLASGVLADLRAVVPDAAVKEIMTMDARVSGAGADTRFYAMILASFAVVALALAGVGLFGVLACNVARRTREFGVRLALGATPKRVQGLVLGHAFALIGIGVAIGLAVTLSGGRILKAFLFEVSPADPWTLASVIALLAVGAMVAAYLPARRASRIDPMTALRCE